MAPSYTASSLAPPYRPPEVPGPGESVDQKLEVRLPSSIEGPVVSITVPGAKIVISRTLLEALASEVPARWSTESERMACLLGARAKHLLELAGSSATPAVDGNQLGDAQYLVQTILEAGRACVHPEGAGKAADRLTVHYYGSSAGPMLGMGHIMFSIEQPKVLLLGVSWFIR